MQIYICGFKTFLADWRYEMVTFGHSFLPFLPDVSAISPETIWNEQSKEPDS